jgi:hypothetical protein
MNLLASLVFLIHGHGGLDLPRTKKSQQPQQTGIVLQKWECGNEYRSISISGQTRYLVTYSLFSSSAGSNRDLAWIVPKYLLQRPLRAFARSFGRGVPKNDGEREPSIVNVWAAMPCTYIGRWRGRTRQVGAWI